MSQDRGVIFGDTFEDALGTLSKSLPEFGVEAASILSAQMDVSTRRLQNVVDQAGQVIEKSAKDVGLEAAKELAKALKHSVYVICISALSMRVLARVRK
jgi:alpha-galactosidase/6-phospho-beta-glucosidase family protein